MRPSEPEPQFVRIRWDEVQEPENRVVSREAFLCKMHRKEMVLKFPSARGCGQLGEACEFCKGEGREACNPAAKCVSPRVTAQSGRPSLPPPCSPTRPWPLEAGDRGS